MISKVSGRLKRRGVKVMSLGAADFQESLAVRLKIRTESFKVRE